jgi:predicted NBD/HSP70 family sugar kinase
MIDPNGELCLCGQIGCVQTVTGGKQIRARYDMEATDIENESVWQHITHALAMAVAESA